MQPQEGEQAFSWNRLPGELKVQILGQVENAGVLSRVAPLVCREWAQLGRDSLVWRPVFLRDFPGRTIERRCVDWKFEYRRAHQLQTNWQTWMFYGRTIQFEPEGDNYISDLHFDASHETYLWLGFRQGVALCDPAQSFAVKAYFRTATRLTRVRFVKEGVGATGHTDGVIQLWDIPKEGRSSLLFSFDEGSDWVNSMEIDTQSGGLGHHIVAGYGNNDIKIWDVEAQQRSSILQGHSAPVSCVKCDDQHVASSSLDKSIRLWDRRNDECACTYTSENTGSVRCFQYDLQRNLLVAGEASGTVSIWDMRVNHEPLETFKAHSNSVQCLQFLGDRLVTGGRDRCARVWKLSDVRDTSPFLLSGTPAFTDWVKAVQMNDSKLFVASSATSVLDFTPTAEQLN
ncbi:WD repeat-containing protein 12 [Balamuthia mandrillaris]